MSSLSYFNEVATSWNNMRKSYFDESLKQISLGNEALSGAVVADLGAGTGFLTHELAKKAQIVFSLDQSKNMLKTLDHQSKVLNYKHVFPIQASMTDIPLFDNSMDYVFSNMALHHIEEPLLVFKEAKRILKSGGKLILTDVLRHDGTWAKTEMYDVWLGFEITQLSQWLKEAGFSDFEIEKTPLVAKGFSSQGEYTEAGIFRLMAIKG